MNKYFIDESIALLMYEFLRTKKPIYVYNILLRYFYFYFLHEKLIDKLDINLEIKPSVTDFNDWYYRLIPEKKIESALSIINSEYWVPLCGVDHTFYYSIDIESNMELFKHFSSLPWYDWSPGGTVLEVGSGFGIYVFLFNLFKRYYSLKKLHIYSFDFDEYKIEKLRSLYQFLNLTDKNDFIIGDCSNKVTFEFLKYDLIRLFYSETFSGKGAHTQDYFRIMDNVFANFDKLIRSEIIFPYHFIINNQKFSAKEYVDYITHSKSDEYKRHFIEAFLINGKYQYLTGYEMDNETAEIREYIKDRFGKRVGFRWGINIV